MKRNFRNLFAQVMLTSLVVGAPAIGQASTNSLGVDSSLGVLSFGDLAMTNGDVQGRVAVGGNATLSSYSINALTGSLYGNGLTVGGNLSFGGGSVFGNTVVGGSLSSNSGASFAGTIQVAGNLNANNNWLTATSISYGGSASGLQQWQNPTPASVSASSVQLGLNFVGEKQRLSSLSQSFDAMSNTGTASDSWGTMVLNANHSDLAVFDLTSADVGKNLRLENLGANTTVIINVAGQTVDFGLHGYQNFSAGQVLFNLPQATQITFASGVNASFLAPLASFSGNGGVINGQVIVNGWSGSTQVNDVSFAGNVTAVPEPETYALMLAGLGVVGCFSRRRRQTA